MTVKRIRLYREDHPTVDGRLLKESTWAPPPLPLLVMRDMGEHAHSNTEIIGTVEHIRRGQDGWITGVIKTPAEIQGLSAEADFDTVEMDSEESTETTMVFKGARLRAVTLGRHPAWKEMGTL